MRWIALLFFLAFGGAYLLNRRRGKKRLEQSLEYRFAFSTDEVFHGEYLYLDQVVVNTSEQKNRCGAFGGERLDAAAAQSGVKALADSRRKAWNLSGGAGGNARGGQ